MPLEAVTHPRAAAWNGRKRRGPKGSAAKPELRRSRPRTQDGTSLSRRFLLLHVVRQLGELEAGGAKSLSGVLAHRGHHIVVQIFDEFGDLLLDPFGGLSDRLADTRRRVLHLAVEVIHKCSSLLLGVNELTATFVDQRLDHYFAPCGAGSMASYAGCSRLRLAFVTGWLTALNVGTRQGRILVRV